MGGMGSGGWFRCNSKSTVDSQHAVDIRYLKKQGFLRTGHFGSLSWSCRGKDTGAVCFRVEETGIQLVYKRRLRNSDEWNNIKQFVLFDYTACNYGGKRTWLLCSDCNRRVICIYGTGTYFLCRYWKTYSRLYQQAMYGKQCFMKKAKRLLGHHGF